MTTKWGWWTRYASIKWNYNFDSAHDCVMTSNIISTENLECFNPYRKGIVWWELMVVDNDDSKEKYFSILDWTSNDTDKFTGWSYTLYWNQLGMAVMTTSWYSSDYSWEKVDTYYTWLWQSFVKHRNPWWYYIPWGLYMNYSHSWLWWPNSWDREDNAKKFDFYIKEPASFVKWYDSCKAISEAWESKWNGHYYITPTLWTEELIYCDMNNISNLRLYFDMTTVNSSWNLYDLSWNWFNWIPLNWTVIWNSTNWYWAGSTLFNRANKNILKLENAPDIFNNNKNHTISILLKPTDSLSNVFILQSSTHVELYSNSDNTFIWRVVLDNYPSSWSIPQTHSWNINTDKWKHLIQTFDNWVLKMYIDWVLIDEQTWTWTDKINLDAILNIWWYEYPACVSSDNCVYSNSYIDEISIYDKTLSESEIKELYNLYK